MYVWLVAADTSLFANITHAPVWLVAPHERELWSPSASYPWTRSVRRFSTRADHSDRRGRGFGRRHPLLIVILFKMTRARNVARTQQARRDATQKQASQRGKARTQETVTERWHGLIFFVEASKKESERNRSDHYFILLLLPTNLYCERTLGWLLLTV